MNTAGIDIGGANLKGARDDGIVVTRAFALWREPEGLAAALRELLAALEPFDRLAVTMTGELCDCYSSKEEGVLHILAAVEEAAAIAPQFWLLDEGLCDLERARAEPLQAAAANWQALSTWAAGLEGNENSLLIDIGSTTTDIIQLEAGKPRAAGRTDPERLQLGELVYTGVRRTPVCALLEEADLGGQACPLAAEHFATSLDAWLLLEEITEDPDCLATADGRPATRRMAQDRLARMLCLDPQELNEEDALTLARQITLAQENKICRAIGRVIEPGKPAGAFISGEGEFLALRALQSLGLEDDLITPMSRICNPAGSEAAGAFALARLAAES
ncbi:MAG: hydantoinase/oxoprolinase family protein [Planctomycetota bacterium]